MKTSKTEVRKNEMKGFLRVLFHNIGTAATDVQIARAEWFESCGKLTEEELESEADTTRVKKIVARSTSISAKILEIENHLSSLGEALCNTLPLLDEYTTVAERAQFLNILESQYKDLDESRGSLWMIATGLEPKRTGVDGEVHAGPLFYALWFALADHPAHSDTDDNWLDVLLPAGRVFNGAMTWQLQDHEFRRVWRLFRMPGEMVDDIEQY
jgi:hypothetical protein